MSGTCFICGGEACAELVRNDLPLVRCEQCGLIRRKTFELPAAHYESLDAGDTPEKRRARLRNSHDRLHLFLRYVPKTSWCDIGTGEGIFLEALAANGGSGVGIEPSAESRKKAEAHGVRIVGSTLGHDAATAIRNEGATVVSLFHLIEHLEAPATELKRLYDALPPGGFLILEAPDISSPVFKTREFCLEHLWYFSRETLRCAVEQAGFRVIASGRRSFDRDGESRIELRILARRAIGQVKEFFGWAPYVWLVAQKGMIGR